jgi:membrane protease YdiL (CAAX protease family)
METSKASDQTISASRSLQETMRRHPLFAYFFLAYAISWILTIPAILAEWNVAPKGIFPIFFTVKSFGPALAAYILVRVTEGNDGWRKLRGGIRQWRVGLGWYAFILLGIPAVMLLGILVLPGALASFQGLPPSFLVSYPISFILIFFAGGPLGEEPGWRGFALPRLQARYGALRGSLLLGVLWTFWHLPDFLTSAQRGGPGTSLSVFYINLPIFFLMVMSMTFIFTWVFNHTGGSLLIALMLHASINAFGTVESPSVFSAPVVTGTDLPVLISFGVMAVLVFALTRGRLGDAGTLLS